MRPASFTVLTSYRWRQQAVYKKDSYPLLKILSSGDRLLTDNWYSGYKDDGALQIGLTYLAEEVGLPLGSDLPFTLQMHVLPLKRTTLPNLVYMNPEGIPSFDESGVALSFSESDIKAHVFRYADFGIESI